MISSRVRELQRRRALGDQGFAMVELMVAMVVFALLAAGVLAGLNMANATGRGNRLRVVAANLAASQIEKVRNSDVSTLVDGYSCPISGGSLPCAQKVEDDAFDVQQYVRSVDIKAESSPCDSPSATYKPGGKLITVTVRWDKMGTIPPVRSDTLMTLGANGLDPNKGNIAVKVLNGDARAQDAVMVTLSQDGGGSLVSQQTDPYGCVIFTNLPPGKNYWAILNLTGYVDQDGNPNPRQLVEIDNPLTAYKVFHRSFDYDQSSGFSLTVNADPGYPVPSAILSVLPVTLGSTTFWATDGYRKIFFDCSSGAGDCSTGYPRQLSNLYPTAYSVWSGGCKDADPGQSDRPAPVVLTPGQTTTVGVDTEAVKITTIDRTTSAVVPDTDVYGVAACGSMGTKYLGRSDASGNLQVSLPWGGWNLSSSSSGTNPTAVSLGPSSPQPTNVQVKK